jgi:hypothetical protein
MKPIRSTKRTLASLVLSFESFVIFFATLAAFGLRDQLGVSEVLVWTIGLSLSFTSIILPALLRYQWAYIIGWVIQVAVFVSGFWLWGMFFIGAIFVGLWGWAMIAGSVIDRARANYIQQLETDE